MTNYGTPLLYYIKLCASFQIHQWIQTGVTVRKHSVRVEIDDFFVPCDLEIWHMILIKNMAHLLCYFKLCASFRSHSWIQTGITVRKRPIWVKIEDFLTVWPGNLTDDLEKQQGTSSMLLQALCIILYPLVNSNWSYSPETSNLGQIRRFLIVLSWNLTDDLDKQ